MENLGKESVFMVRCSGTFTYGEVRYFTIVKSRLFTISSILQTAVCEFKKAKAIPKGLSAPSLSFTNTPEPESPSLKNISLLVFSIA